MKNIWTVRAIVMVIAIVLLGMGIDAIAGMGWGGRGMGYGYSRDLTDAQISQIAAERQAFMKATEGIREQLREKAILLRAEYGKKAPDTAQITSLQSEVNTLRSQFDTARLKHILAIKKIDPNFISGPGSGRGMGRGGMGRGCGNGMGGYGRGYCMNY